MSSVHSADMVRPDQRSRELIGAMLSSLGNWPAGESLGLVILLLNRVIIGVTDVIL